MPTASASAKTQPRAHMPLSGRRFGSFSGKTQFVFPTAAGNLRAEPGLILRAEPGLVLRAEPGLVLTARTA